MAHAFHDRVIDGHRLCVPAHLPVLLARVTAHHFLAPTALEPGVGDAGAIGVDVRDGDAAVATDDHWSERNVLAFFTDEVAGMRSLETDIVEEA